MESGRLKKCFPPLQWLPSYSPQWLLRDGTAGITLAAYAIPVALAYSSLAGMPPESGIYCYLVGGLGYALLGTSRQLAIGPTSAIAMLVGTTVAGMANGDTSRWIAIASLTAFAVAALCALAWLFRLSSLVNFISETILIGFKAGAALTIAMTQLPKLFGVPGGGDHFFERLAVLASQWHQTNLLVLSIGIAAFVTLLLGDRYLPGRPVALAVVAMATLMVAHFELERRAVAIVGVVPSGLPAFAWPSLRFQDVDAVFPLAAACFLLGYVESISAARTLAARHHYDIDARQELLALGSANLLVAFSQGFPITGGLSQSSVNDQAGARSSLALVFASLAIGICLLFLTNLLRDLPTVVLASIVLFAVKGLIDLSAFGRLWRVNRFEFWIACVAMVGVLVFGILKGVLIAAMVSLLVLLGAVSRPHVAFLGRIPGTRRYSDLERHPENETIPGVLIFRVEASLLYFNVEHVRNLVRERLGFSDSLQMVVCDLSNSPILDVAGADMLVGLAKELQAQGIELRVVEAHARSRDLLRAVGVDRQLGNVSRWQSIDEVVGKASRTSEG